MGDDSDELIVTPRDKKGLRTGYTTGSCAAAAAKAATLALMHQAPVENVTIKLPINQAATFSPVNWKLTKAKAYCCIVKDAGDDPDVTHGALICAEVEWKPAPGLELAGGVGVGVVTKPGLGLEVGGPAINPVPREMITYSVKEAAADTLEQRGLKVTISVPRGEELAKKTLNARLGIIGGISILGTTGIVKPYSTASWRASVVQAIQVAAANGCKEVVLSTGGRTEKLAQQLMPGLSELAFVEMGIFTGDALKACVREGLAEASIVGMIGKVSKLAQGHLQTHVAGNQVDFKFLAEMAKRCGASKAVQAQILSANSARHVAEIAVTENVMALFPLLCKLTCEKCFAHVHGALSIEVILFDFDGEILGRVSRAR